MMSRTHRRLFVIAFTILLMSGAAGAGAQEQCTAASLDGSYAFQVDGANVSNPYLPPGPFAAVGRNTYDGKGHLGGSIVVSANGSIIPATYTGTYTVNPDCTGHKSALLSLGLVVEFDFVIDDNLREIRMIVTRAGPPNAGVDGLTVSGTARKLFAHGKSKDGHGN